ncbi:MAG: phosphoribosylglycinamide synthetase C domain-containing protein [Candidatus Nanopelagicales bacterium]
MLAAQGYPQKPVTGDVITGADQPGVLHAGTAERDGQIVSAGGRVLNVVATAATLTEAREKAYKTLAGIDLRGSQYRTDIRRSEGLADDPQRPRQPLRLPRDAGDLVRRAQDPRRTPVVAGSPAGPVRPRRGGAATA